MSNQQNEKYADEEVIEAIKSLMATEEKIDKALHVEFGVGDWAAGPRGLSGHPMTIAKALMWANGYETRIHEKSELLITLRKAPANLKLSVLTLAKRVAAADWGV